MFWNMLLYSFRARPYVVTGVILTTFLFGSDSLIKFIRWTSLALYSLADSELLVVEFHFTEVDNIVRPVNDHVDLETVLRVISLYDIR